MQSRTVCIFMMVGALVVGLASNGFASAFGTLGNFDVVNDTTHDCHGFEIELEDTHTSDVPYTFGGSYSRYGAPQVVDATVDPAHPRAIVRYRSWNGTRWEATPVAPAGMSPSGHDCFQGGPVGNYLSSGCEHYGASLRVNPTRTTYRWLVAANPTDQNTAFSVAPENVQLPVPVWNVAPRVGGGVDVRVEVEPVEEEIHVQRGEPQWLKVFKIQSDRDLQPEDLNLLLLGLAGGIVPDDETEVETEWKLIQSKPGNAEEADEDADVREEPLDEGKRSVIRRYEFHRYTGARDPENNEALPCIADDNPVPDAAPVDGCSDLGDFVGAQNVAVDIDLTAVDNVLPAGEVGVAYPDTVLVLGGLPPYVVEVTGGSVPAGLQVDGVTGILAGTPTLAGGFSFDLRATDAAGAVVTTTFDVTVTEDLCPADPDKDAPGACGCGVPDVDSDGDGVADCLDLCPFDPAKTDPGLCGCDVPESSCADLCPDDPAKTEPGICGCGVADGDSDGDGVADCVDECPTDVLKTTPGSCGCGAADADTDGDGSADCLDGCPADAAKTTPGACGCGVADDDTNANGIADCTETERADLAAAARQSTSRPRALRRVKYELRATNLGPDWVPSATIRAAVSGGPFSDLRLPKGCTGTAAAIVCTTGRLAAGRRGSKTISLIPAAGATISVTATVASPLVDPNPANQTASVTTMVP